MISSAQSQGISNLNSVYHLNAPFPRNLPCSRFWALGRRRVWLGSFSHCVLGAVGRGDHGSPAALGGATLLPAGMLLHEGRPLQFGVEADFGATDWQELPCRRKRHRGS